MRRTRSIGILFGGVSAAALRGCRMGFVRNVSLYRLFSDTILSFLFLVPLPSTEHGLTTAGYLFPPMQ